MIVCRVHLLPMRSSRGAEAPPDYVGRMWFRRVPIAGEEIALADEHGDGTDWNLVEEGLAGNVYMVETVRWSASCCDDRNPPVPVVYAQRYSQVEPPPG